MTRIEIHLTEQEVKMVDSLADAEGRSRKNFCETQIRKLLTGVPVLAVRQKKKK